MFKALGIEEEDQQKVRLPARLVEVRRAPHGGIAFGVDRMVALMAGVDQIRDVIAFPRPSAGRTSLIGTPSTVTEQQLRELHIRIRPSDQA